MAKILAYIIIATVVAISVGLDCSNLITKQQQGLLSYYAHNNFTAPIGTGSEGWTLTMLFDQNFTSLGVYGEHTVEYDRDAKWAIIYPTNESTSVQQGELMSLRFRIRYGLEILQPPEVVSSRFQAIELCR